MNARLLACLALGLGACAVTPEDGPLGAKSSELTFLPPLDIVVPRWEPAFFATGVPVGLAWAPPALVTAGTNDVRIFAPCNNGQTLSSRRWDGTSIFSDGGDVTLPAGVTFAKGVAPVAVQNGADFDIFFVSARRQLLHMKRTPSGWATFGSSVYEQYVTSDIIGVSVARTVIGSNPVTPWLSVDHWGTRLFFLRVNGTLEEWSRVDNGGWSFERFRSGVTTTPAVASSGPGRFDLVYRVGSGSTLTHESFTSTGWTTQASVVVPDGVQSSPTLTSRAAGKLDLFVATKSGIRVSKGDAATFSSTWTLVAPCVKTDSTWYDPAWGLPRTTASVASYGTDQLFMEVLAQTDFFYVRLYRTGSLNTPAPTPSEFNTPPCPGCGAADRPCCGGTGCESGLACSSGACKPCGGADQLCCGGSACEGSLQCGSDGACHACGHSGEACCTTGAACGFALACMSGSCRAPVFATDVYPLLDVCKGCHTSTYNPKFYVGGETGAEPTRSNLNTLIAPSATKVVVPGSPKDSALYIQTSTGNMPMGPPEIKLKDFQIAIIRAWIEGGAK